MSSSTADLPPSMAAAPAAGGCGGKCYSSTLLLFFNTPLNRQVHLSLVDTEAT